VCSGASGWGADRRRIGRRFHWKGNRERHAMQAGTIWFKGSFGLGANGTGTEHRTFELEHGGS